MPENQNKPKPTMESLTEQEGALMREAVEIINRQFLNLPEGIGSPSAERFVECTVSLALLAMSKMLVNMGPPN